MGLGSLRAGGKYVDQEGANLGLLSAETAPKAMERSWLLTRWGQHHGAARGDNWVKAVFWLCIFCTGSAVNLPRWPSCVEKAQPELCLLEPTEELVSAWEGGCKQRERGW